MSYNRTNEYVPFVKLMYFIIAISQLMWIVYSLHEEIIAADTGPDDDSWLVMDDRSKELRAFDLRVREERRRL